jgi:hypothetical protein
MKSSFLRKVVIGTFLSVPAISSIISTIHLIDLFNLGNPTWLSILLAVTFELGSIASLLAISVIERIKVGAIWFIFFILSALQIIGNVYYSYSFTSEQILANPIFLTNFMDLFSFITGDEIRDVKIFLSCIIGIPIPLIALFFLKSNIDYLKPSSKSEPQEQIVKEVKVVVEEKHGPVEEPVKSPILAKMEVAQEAQTDVEHDDPNIDDHVIINTEPIQEEPSVEDSSNEVEEIVETVVDEPTQEEKIEPEDVIHRDSSSRKKGRYVFDERGTRLYDI